MAFILKLHRLGALFVLWLIMACAIADEAKRPWDVELGLGLASTPGYRGADNTNVLLRPWVDASFTTQSNGTFVIDSGSLTNDPELRWDAIGSRDAGAGILVGYRSGRRENGRGLAGLSKRTALPPGLPEVADAVDLGIEGHVTAFGLPLFAQVRSALNGRQGTLVNLGVYAAVPLRRAELTILPTLTWADRRQLQAFFGVTPATSSATGLMQYRPASGFEAAALELGADWPLSSGWHLVASVAYQRLLSNAARSPIVRSMNQTSGLVGVALHL